jgi:hypothetical protein
MADNYDSPWKRALKHNLLDFIAFFFPQYRDLIKRHCPISFRDKELAEISGNRRPRTLIADLLVSVFLCDGREVLLHIEIQAQRDPNLAERILDYNHCLYKNYRLPVASFVVLADVGKHWRQDAFHTNVLGTEMGIRFSVVKLSAYAELLDEPLLDRNVFAWVTAAHLLAQRTHGNADARYAEKWRLIRLLYERGWRKRRIIDLFTIVHWLMPLPAERESRLVRSIRRLERRHNVEWINPYDKLRFEEGEKKGIKIGLAKGLQEGRQEGRQEGAAQLLERQLNRRFGTLSPTIQKRLAKASPEQLARWSEAVLEAQTLKQVFSTRP